MTINGPAPMVLGFFLNAAIDQQCEKWISAQGKVAEVEQKIDALYAAARRAASALPGRAARGQRRPRPHAARRLGRRGAAARDLREDPRRHALGGARHGAGRHPQGGSGAEHLHLLDRVRAAPDGRHPAVLHRPRRCGTSTRCRSPAITSPRPGRTRSRSSRSRSRTASRSSSTTCRAGCTSTTSRRTCRSSSRTAWTPSTRCSAASRAGSGRKAIRDKYGGNDRSQKLKYHIQTSGRSLHAQEIAFNDIRTTLQALLALNDNCNSLHTNAYDEAITTPTEESVRRALAIQLVINKEFGLVEEREPDPGLVHHRGADRSRRGGGAHRVPRRSPSAAACSARWSGCTSARRSRKSRSTTRR